jgi:hypothetical protein
MPPLFLQDSSSSFRPTRAFEPRFQVLRPEADPVLAARLRVNVKRSNWGVGAAASSSTRNIDQTTTRSVSTDPFSDPVQITLNLKMAMIVLGGNCGE